MHIDRTAGFHDGQNDVWCDDRIGFSMPQAGRAPWLMTNWLDASSESYSDNAVVTTAHNRAPSPKFLGQDLGITWDNWTGGANGPIFKTNILNGLPCFRFDGVDDYLLQAHDTFTRWTYFYSGYDFYGGTQEYHFVFIPRGNPLGEIMGQDSYWSTSLPDWQYNNIWGYFGNLADMRPAFFQNYYSSATYSYLSSSSLTVGTAYALGWSQDTYASGYVNGYINNSTVANTTSLPNGPYNHGVVLGGHDVVDLHYPRYGNIDILEFIEYYYPLSWADTAATHSFSLALRVREYFRSKYNLW